LEGGKLSSLSTNPVVLVTGADGFIGSHLTESLVRLGYTVRAFTLYNSFNTWGWLDNCAHDVKGNFEVISGDIRDPYGVRKAVEGADVVLHLAALIAIPFSYTSPDAYVETNVRGTLNLLQAARDYDVSKFVHTSTSEVYGTAKFVPITEEHPLQGQSPYSATKIGADQIANAFHSSFNVPVTTLRPFNTYGPRQSMRAVIPTVITQIASGMRNIKLGATSPTRDFSYVQDTVDGFIAAMNSHEGVGKVFNLGSNFEISIGETVSEISRLMDIEVTIETEEERKRPDNSEVERLWADNSRAKSLLNWTPKYEGISGFQSGLQKTIEWFEKPENLMHFKSGIYNK
jgi:NAD dependent epimerase/dehydratase